MIVKEFKIILKWAWWAKREQNSMKSEKQFMNTTISSTEIDHKKGPNRNFETEKYNNWNEKLAD